MKDNRAKDENRKNGAEKMLFSQVEIGNLFHDGFYAKSACDPLEYQVYEKITKSKARCVWQQGNRQRMLQQVYSFGANKPVWKIQE